MQIKTFFRRLLGLHVTEEEIQNLIEEGEQEGVINSEEQAMIEAVLDLGETRVREVLVPRTDIVAIEKDMPLEQVLKTIISAGHSRIPIYDGDIDHVLGILYAKDLLKYWGKAPYEVNLGSIIHQAYFIPEGKTIGDLLKEFKARKVHMAVAVDEYGGTAGVITIEDILEEIVGDIQDEYDAEEQISFIRLDDGRYNFDARYHIEDFQDELGVSLARGDYDTLGGFISHTLGHVPERGEQCDVGSIRFSVEEADARKVTRILVTRLEDGELKSK